MHRYCTALPILLTAVLAPLVASAQSADAPAPAPTEFRVFHLHSTSGDSTYNIVSAIRHLVSSRAHVDVASNQVILVYASPDELDRAAKAIAELDAPHPLYRLKYTFHNTGSMATSTPSQSYEMTLSEGGKGELKQGSRVPITETSGPNAQLTYLDVGLNIEASIDGTGQQVILHSKLSESSLTKDQPATGSSAPIILSTQLEQTSTLVPSKPLIIGSLDVPGSSGHQTVEVQLDAVSQPTKE